MPVVRVTLERWGRKAGRAGWGRFGGGWRWKLGVQAGWGGGTVTIIASLGWGDARLTAWTPTAWRARQRRLAIGQKYGREAAS